MKNSILFSIFSTFFCRLFLHFINFAVLLRCRAHASDLSKRRDAFLKRKKQVRAKTAAEEVDVSLASFYKYAKGQHLPHIETLRRVGEKWNVK